ncbi:tyrosine-type recombinase/integrase [Bradyrhizobium sp. USDA 4452]
MPLEVYRRGGIWHCRGTVGPNGRRKRIRQSLHTKDKDTAARQATEIEKKYWDGHFDGPAAILTFAAAARMYRNAGKSDQFLAPIEKYLGVTLVKDITEGSVQEMAKDLYPNCGGASLNRMVLVPTKAVINHAASRKLCSRLEVKPYEIDAKVREPATLEWVEKFMAEAGPHIGTMALFMFLTGARVGEAVALRPDDLNLQEATALIRQTKNRAERSSHLPVPLVVALANLQPVNGRVFGYVKPANLRSAWDGAVARAKIKHLSPHCCRHGFATGLLRAGVDVVTVAWLGGWKSAKQVLATYGHANKDPKLIELLLRRAAPPVTQSAEAAPETATKTASYGN